MLGLGEDKTEKRIKKLFSIYVEVLNNGLNIDRALTTVWGEITSRETPLKADPIYKKMGHDARIQLLKDRFSLIDPNKYDVYKAIQFIVTWEFPEKYNKKLSLDEIRSGKNIHTKLESTVKKIGNEKLKDVKFRSGTDDWLIDQITQLTKKEGFVTWPKCRIRIPVGYAGIMRGLEKMVDENILTKPDKEGKYFLKK